MKLNTILLFAALVVSCKHSKNTSRTPTPPASAKVSDKISKRIPTLKDFNITEAMESYDKTKRAISQKQQTFNKSNISIIQNEFKTSLLNEIIPYWEGTEWSFEGHTSIPKKGNIACGYFVSTTLKHVGLNLNRYKLAQQNPYNEARSLAINNPVKVIQEESTEKKINAISKHLPEGIHFIGFDQGHVGYIVKEKGEIYLIHSNYIDATGVIIENILDSEVFPFYNQYYLVELSTNIELLNKWIDGSELKIYSS